MLKKIGGFGPRLHYDAAALGDRMNNFRKFALVSLAATVTAAILFSEADAQTGVKRKKKGPPDYCSTQYDPVCARTVQGILTTFNNECSAHKGGAAVIA